MARTVKASALVKDDQFPYSSGTVQVLAVTPVDNRIVEVHCVDNTDKVRWIDYGLTETVEVTSGPSASAPVVKAPLAATSATQRARNAVRLGKVRSLPASASLVLYALAAAQDESSDAAWVPTLGSVATGAGLAQSTTAGHLRALAAKGLVGGSNDGGWEVAL